MVGYGRKGEASTFDTTPDWELVPGVAERAVRRVPALADAEVMRAWAGLYEMTPDQMGILSALPGAAGLFVVAGFSGHGFMHGPIAGQLVAELVADGRAHTVDVAPLDIDHGAPHGKELPASVITMQSNAAAAINVLGVAGRHTGEQRGHSPRRDIRQRDARQHASERQHNALPHHQRHDRPPLCAERQPNAELVDSL